MNKGVMLVCAITRKKILKLEQSRHSVIYLLLGIFPSISSGNKPCCVLVVSALLKFYYLFPVITVIWEVSTDGYTKVLCQSMQSLGTNNQSFLEGFYFLHQGNKIIKATSCWTVIKLLLCRFKLNIFTSIVMSALFITQPKYLNCM